MAHFEQIYPQDQYMGQLYPADGLTYTSNDTFEVSNTILLIRGHIVTDNNRTIYVANNGGFAGRHFILHDPVSIHRFAGVSNKRKPKTKRRKTKTKKTKSKKTKSKKTKTKRLKPKKTKK